MEPIPLGSRSGTELLLFYQPSSVVEAFKGPEGAILPPVTPWNPHPDWPHSQKYSSRYPADPYHSNLPHDRRDDSLRAVGVQVFAGL